MAITFMAKYDEREGNSCHIHLSLQRDDGTPLFADDDAAFESLPRRPARLPATSCACSTRRTSTPTSASPPARSRRRRSPGATTTAPARCASSATAPRRRIELRLPGADVNPYLAIARDHRRRPARDGATSSSSSPRSRATPTRPTSRDVPRTLRDARDAFAGQRRRPRGVRRRRSSTTTSTTPRRARGVRRRGHRLGARPRVRAAVKLAAAASRQATLFAPVRSQTAFEETLERLGTAIKLGLLEPGARLPAERELCRQLGHLALDAAPGADRARAERAPARRRAGAAAARSWPSRRRRRDAPSADAARGLARRLRPAARGRARRRGARRRAGGARRRSSRSTSSSAEMDADAGGLPRLPPGRRALAHRARRGDRQPRRSWRR